MRGEILRKCIDLNFNKFVSYSLLAHLFIYFAFIVLPHDSNRKYSGLSVIVAGGSKNMEIFLEDAIEIPDLSGLYSEALPDSIKMQEPEMSAPSGSDSGGNDNGKSYSSEEITSDQKFRIPPGTGFSAASRNSLIDPHTFEKSSLVKGDTGFLLPDGDDFKDLAYLKDLTDAVQLAWKWPAEAALKGEKGDLYVRLKIGRTGALEMVEVIKSSNNQYLDQAVLEAIKGEFPYKPLPDGWNKTSLTLIGHFIYQ